MAPPTPYDVSCVGPQHFYPTFNSPSFHCHAVEVEVDPDTGQVRVLKYVVAQDVGKALVPPAIEGQIQGGVLQGIGMALFEEELLRDGVVRNTGLDSYKLPTILEAPDVSLPARGGTVGRTVRTAPGASASHRSSCRRPRW